MAIRTETENWERKFHDKMHPESYRAVTDRMVKRFALRFAMKQLPREQHDVILYRILGFTADEMTTILSVSRRTITTRLTAANKRLKKILREKV